MSENTAKITDHIADSRNSCEHEPGVTCPNCKREENVSERALKAAEAILFKDRSSWGVHSNPHKQVHRVAEIIDKHMRPADKGWHLATEKPLSMVPLMVERNCGVSPLQAYYSAEHANFYCQTTHSGLGSTVMRWRYFDPTESRPAEPTSAEWKPCPWCRSDKITVEWEPCPPLDATDTNRRWFAECTQCSCQGPFCQTEAQVKPAWNLRPPAQTGKVELLEQEIANMARALDAIYNHNEAARSAVLEHYGGFHSSTIAAIAKRHNQTTP